MNYGDCVTNIVLATAPPMDSTMGIIMTVVILKSFYSINLCYICLNHDGNDMIMGRHWQQGTRGLLVLSLGWLLLSVLAISLSGTMSQDRN